MTVAPLSDNCLVMIGPAAAQVKSATLIPEKICSVMIRNPSRSAGAGQRRPNLWIVLAWPRRWRRLAQRRSGEIGPHRRIVEMRLPLGVGDGVIEGTGAQMRIFKDVFDSADRGEQNLMLHGSVHQLVLGLLLNECTDDLGNPIIILLADL